MQLGLVSIFAPPGQWSPGVWENSIFPFRVVTAAGVPTIGDQNQSVGRTFCILGREWGLSSTGCDSFASLMIQLPLKRF